MSQPNIGVGAGRPRTGKKDVGVSAEHYLRLLVHRIWLVLGVAVSVAGITAVVSHFLPNVYKSETVILVDPQKVPETYVKSTVTGDVRNRLSTLSQQILSATRLQRIVDTLNLYPDERKTMAREDVIAHMRSDISVQVVSDFGGTQDFQAFRITYSGRDPNLVAQVTNQLASLFIEENLKAREQQAAGTTEFIESQLQESRKNLDEQEGKLKHYRLTHIGEMPEQQTADLQIMGQLQSQMQLEGDALNRAEQSKAVLQTMLSQTAPVVDLDDRQPRPVTSAETKGNAPTPPSRLETQIRNDKAKLSELMSRYTPDHPDVRKLRKQIQQEEAAQAAALAAAPAPPPQVATSPEPAAPAPVAAPAKVVATNPVPRTNPVVQSQINSLEAEIAKREEETRRLSKQIGIYQAKLSAIPVREQEMTQLVRDYEISKAHYSQLLTQQLSAQSATQLEIRQKGEKFEVLDPGQVAQRPDRPNRALINGAGAAGGLVLGVVAGLATEFLGSSITSAEDLATAVAVPVLEVIPLILTRIDRRRRIRRMILGSASVFAMCVLLAGILFYRSQS